MTMFDLSRPSSEKIPPIIEIGGNAVEKEEYIPRFPLAHSLVGAEEYARQTGLVTHSEEVLTPEELIEQQHQVDKAKDLQLLKVQLQSGRSVLAQTVQAA